MKDLEKEKKILKKLIKKSLEIKGKPLEGIWFRETFCNQHTQLSALRCENCYNYTTLVR